MAVVTGAIVPHAPVLALEHHSDRLGASVDALRAAVGSVEFDDCELLVLASPHGRATGVYATISGSLDGFGVRSKRVSASTDEVAELARRWGHSILDPPVDHGITGALLLWGRPAERPVVAATFATTTGPGAPGDLAAVAEGAEVLADAVTATFSGRRIGFLASAHTSAALSPSGPLLDRPEGHELDETVLAALESDCGELAHIDPEIWKASGACGSGPLIAFGRLFAGRRADLLAYEIPAGIGYLVATVVGE